MRERSVLLRWRALAIDEHGVQTAAELMIVDSAVLTYYHDLRVNSWIGDLTQRLESEIEPRAGADTWVRWQGRFGLAPGSAVTLLARATDGDGALQAEAFSLPQPDGSSGWNAIEVQAKRA